MHQLKARHWDLAFHVSWSISLLSSIWHISLSDNCDLSNRYNIKPIFFSSLLDWTPLHHQEEVRPGYGDHMLSCLPNAVCTMLITFLTLLYYQQTSLSCWSFLSLLKTGVDSSGMHLSTVLPCGASSRSPANKNAGNGRPNLAMPPMVLSVLIKTYLHHRSIQVCPMINTHVPLRLGSSMLYNTINLLARILLKVFPGGHLIFLNLLSVQLICRQQSSTIISYCPDKVIPMTQIPFLHECICFAGKYTHSYFQSHSSDIPSALTLCWC